MDVDSVLVRLDVHLQEKLVCCGGWVPACQQRLSAGGAAEHWGGRVMASHPGHIYYCSIMLLLLLQPLFWRRFRAIILLSVAFSFLLSQFVLLFASAFHFHAAKICPPPLKSSDADSVSDSGLILDTLLQQQIQEF